MRSTGEVMGITADFPTAFAKAQAAAGASLPTSGTAFITVTDGDKPAATQLAASLHDLGRYDEAIAAYRACSDLRGWPEEAAWACYREATCLTELKRWTDAIDACARGLVIRPATATLADSGTTVSPVSSMRVTALRSASKPARAWAR